jgi:hypothetical protein
VPYRSSEDCLVGLDVLSLFPETDDRIASVPVSPDNSRNARFAVCVGEDSDHSAVCVVHCCVTCLTLERAYM